MKKIGMIVAVEINAVLNKYGSQLVEKTMAGYQILEYRTDKCEMIIVNCGVGEIAAAGAAQFLISAYGVELIVNFGVVGGLTAEMSKTKTCIVEKVVYYDMDTSAFDGFEVGRYEQYPDVYIPATAALVDKATARYPELKRVICASADKFVDGLEAKSALHERFGADICEMEAAGIVLTCNRNGIPCLLIKIVSDGITGGAEEFNETKDSAAIMCFEIVSGLIDEM